MSFNFGTNWFRSAWPIALLYGVGAFFLLFFSLGNRSLFGSEDRWAEIARNMLLYCDWFHPIINGEVYFDKPLFSYWMIVFASFFTRGLNEFAVRLPSALCALMTLFFTYGIGNRLFNRRVGHLSVLLTATSYGFLFWSHTASADLSNLALTYAAIFWFVCHRDDKDFGSYLVFYLICAVGCQLKGLTALIVPLLVAFVYLVRRSRLKGHLNPANISAAALAAVVFLLPYAGAAMWPLPAGISEQRNHLTGIALLLRENFVRYVEPYDHVAPFYVYFYEVPRILFPWVFLFLGAIIHFGRRYRFLDEMTRWAFDAVLVIFLFFTLSGSRRWYYILPILPMCTLLISVYLVDANADRVRDWMGKASAFLIGVVALAMAALPTVAWRIAGIMSHELVAAAVVTVASGLLAIALVRRSPSTALFFFDSSQSGKLLFAMLLLAAVEMASIFGLVMPALDQFRQLKPFAQSLAHAMQNHERLVFFRRVNTTVAFYVNSPRPIPVIYSRNDLPENGGGFLIIVDDIDREAFFEQFPELKTAPPAFTEARLSVKWAVDTQRMAAYRVP